VIVANVPLPFASGRLTNLVQSTMICGSVELVFDVKNVAPLFLRKVPSVTLSRFRIVLFHPSLNSHP